MQGCVEDFTGRGVADLREGIIRTPLPPTETFLDGVCTCCASSLRAEDFLMCVSIRYVHVY